MAWSHLSRALKAALVGGHGGCFGGRCGAGAGLICGRPSRSLCFQNVERLLENMGIKVGCLGAGHGRWWRPHKAGDVHRTGHGMGAAVRGPAPSTPHHHTDVCPAGDRGDLGRELRQLPARA